MNVTIFESLSDLKDFILNAKELEVYNCVGRQDSENKENKVVYVTELALYTNLGVLFHTSRNEYKTKTTMPPIAKKETELLDDKEDLFKDISTKYNMIKASVTIDKRGNVNIGYQLKTKEKEVKRTII